MPPAPCLLGLCWKKPSANEEGEAAPAASHSRRVLSFCVGGRTQAGKESAIGATPLLLCMRLAVTSLSAPIISSRLGGNNRGNNKLESRIRNGFKSYNESGIPTSNNNVLNDLI